MSPSFSPTPPQPTDKSSIRNTPEYNGLDTEFYPKGSSNNGNHGNITGLIIDLNGDIHFNGSTVPSRSSNFNDKTGISLPSSQQTQQPPLQYESNHTIVVGILVGLIILLCLILGFLTLPAVVNYFRRRIPVSQERIDRRYATIDGWLVTKTVHQHDANCDRIKALYGKRKDETSHEDVNSPEKDSNEALGTGNGWIETIGLAEGCPQTGGSATPSSESSCHASEANSGGRGTAIVDQQGRRNGDDDDDDNKDVTAFALLDKLGIPEHGSKAGRRRDRKFGKNRGSHAKSEGRTKGAAVQIRSIANAKEDTSNRDGLPALVNSPQPSDVDNKFESDAKAHRHHTDDQTPPGANFQPDWNSNASVNSDDSMTKPSCSICLEHFRVGDKVSWSASERCTHAYHHACIREWLLRKVECPCCREIVLPVDRPPRLDGRHGRSSMRRPLSEEVLSKLANERAYRATTTYFCVDCGLVGLEGFGPNHWSKINELCRTCRKSGGHASKAWHFWRMGKAESEDGRGGIHAEKGKESPTRIDGLPPSNRSALTVTRANGSLSQHMVIVANDTMDEEDDYGDDYYDNDDDEWGRRVERGRVVDVEAQRNEQS